MDLVRRALLAAAAALAATACSAAKPAEKRTPPRFRVATFNINWGNVDLSKTVRTIRDSKADLVALQETNAESERHIRTKLRGDYATIFFRGHDGRYEAERFGLLVKSPVKELKFVPPKGGIFGALILRTWLGGREVQIANLHLMPWARGGGELIAMAKEMARMEGTHATEITNIHAALWGKVPTIVLGDFNSHSGMNAPVFLKKQGFVDSFASVTEHPERHPTWRWKHGGVVWTFRLDHIFHSGEMRTVSSRIVKCDSSDHDLVTSVLEWQPQKAGAAPDRAPAAEDDRGQ